MKKNIVLSILGIAFFIVWWCIPTFHKWQADREVDALCAKDGGIKVYETVTLSKSRFNQIGQPQIPDKKNIKPEDDYFYTWTTKDIRGRVDQDSLGALVIFRTETTYFRNADKKIVGRIINYARRGGDPISYFHPSHYSCQNVEKSSNHIFIPSAL